MNKIPIIINKDVAIKKRVVLEQLLSAPENSDYYLLNFQPEELDKFLLEYNKSGASVVIAAGGDGTVSSVAGAIIKLNLNLKLGILPLGTFNHFAKDLDIPLHSSQALEVIRKGKGSQVDVGKVKDIYFLNNSSIGIYPRIVRIREKINAHGFPKKLALLAAIMKIFRSKNYLTLQFESGNALISKVTPFVFIGNNKYEISGSNIGAREHVDEGIFSVLIINDISKTKMLGLGVKALLGNVMEEKDFNIIGLHKLTITSPERRINVAHDGEVTQMESPLSYEILPLALSVIIP